MTHPKGVVLGLIEKRWFLLFQMKPALGGSPHNIGLRQEVLAQDVGSAKSWVYSFHRKKEKLML